LTDINLRLVADLARLVSRYDAEDWAALSRLLQDAESRKALAAMLDELAQASARQRSTGRPQRPASPSNIRGRLAELEKTDPERAQVLNDLWMKVRSREVLPDTASVRAFSEAVGIKTLVVRRRDQAISEILEHLITLPDVELQDALSRATIRVDRRLGEEYEKWVALILGRDIGPN
jgi:hypothetical protein